MNQFKVTNMIRPVVNKVTTAIDSIEFRLNDAIGAQVFPTFGRGVVAMQYIDEGQLLERCPVLPLSSEDTTLVNKTSLKQYTFIFDKEKNQDCLVMGLGELYNHSETPNVGYRLDLVTKTMEFYTLRPIAQGEQLFTDYRQDDNTIDLEEYF